MERYNSIGSVPRFEDVVFFKTVIYPVYKPKIVFIKNTAQSYS